MGPTPMLYMGPDRAPDSANQQYQIKVISTHPDSDRCTYWVKIP